MVFKSIGSLLHRTIENKPLFSVTLGQLVRILGRSQAWIFIPVYLSRIRDIPYVYIGLLFFLSALLSLPVSIYGGNLVDKIGRRLLIVSIPIMVSIIFLSLGLAVSFSSNIFIVFALFILIEPFASLQGILDNVVVTDVTEEAERINAFGIVRIAGNIGFSIGPAIGGFLAYEGYEYIFFVPAALSVVESLIFFLYIKDVKIELQKDRKPFQFPSSNRPFIIISILIAMIFFVAGQWGTTLTLFWNNIYHMSNREIGILYTVNGLIVVFFQVPVSTLFRKIKDYVSITIGGLIYSLSFLAMGISSSFLFLIFDVILLTMAENIVSPVSMSLVSKFAPSDKRGQYFGAYQLIQGFISPLAPLYGTFLLGFLFFTPLGFWSFIAIPGIVISLFVLRFGSRKERGTISKP